jgi:hypothetical protein
MQNITQPFVKTLFNRNNFANGSTKLATQQKFGTHQTQAVNGIGNTPKPDGHMQHENVGQNVAHVHVAKSYLTAWQELPKKDFVQPSAKAQRDVKAALMTLIKTALTAETLGGSTNTVKLVVAPQSVASNCTELHAVYALSVEEVPVYFAEGVLVSNCDAHQYACLHADGGEMFGANAQVQRREVIKVKSGGWT